MALQDVVPKPRPPLAEPSSSRTDRDGKAIRNLLLLSIPDDEFNLLRPLLEAVDLPRYKVLYEQGSRIEQAHFLNEGMISLVVVANDGRSVEVGICGREGFIGLPLIFGFGDSPTRAIVQLPGRGLSIPASNLVQAFSQCPQLHHLIHQYAFSQQLQVAQIAACNRLHDMEHRLARWLLMCQDTVDSSLLPLTHEFIAQMLGTGRPTVTIAAGVLERAGLIENTRGAVKIIDRKRLEGASCECYSAIQNFSASRAVL